MAPLLPLLWGIVNVTPDSFSDGGRFLAPREAAAHGRALLAEGAGVLDVGGESTRPGADPVPPAEEIDRVVPVLAALAPDAHAAGARLSVDTRHAEVAEAALEAGATIVNDVTGGGDPGMLQLVARREAGIVLMHMHGTPRTMQQDPVYEDVVAEVAAWLAGRARVAEAAGIARERVRIDPGLGFGKTFEHNLALLRSLETFVDLGWPVLLGASRKSFLGRITGEPVPERRLAGSLACAVRAYEAGVHDLRVHDVRATREILEVLAVLAVRNPGRAPRQRGRPGAR